MRKQMIIPEGGASGQDASSWLNLDELAEVEITSERPEAPVEGALLPHRASGWRSAEPGEQIIRILFSAPQVIQRIQLVFVENRAERTQEFVLRWLPKSATAYQEIVRQQYVFSPPGTTRELEDYRFELKDLVALELRIVPDISGRTAFASLQSLRLA